MRLSSLFSAAFVVSVAAGATIIACGGGGGGGNNGADAKVFKDAPGSGSGSGSNTANAVGESCTAGSNIQGSCPTGYDCVGPQSGSGAFCTRACTMGSGDDCDVGYTGAGFASCILQIGSGASAIVACGVICAEVGSNMICPPGDCIGVCPTGLTCSLPIQASNGSGSAVTVGSACL
jgi:hypothetical protein